MAPASPGEAMTAPVGAAELDAPEEMENDGPDLDRYSSDDIVEMTDRWLEGPAGPMDGAHGPAMAFAAPVAGAPEQQLTSAEDPAEEK